MLYYISSSSSINNINIYINIYILYINIIFFL